jgi:bile acid-coenzyme A ligase
MEEMPISTAVRVLAENDPGRPSITHEGRTITRAELDSRTNRLARAYESLGVGRDDLVVIALPNSIGFYEAAVAAWKLGATPMPISSRLPEAERDALIELADPPLVVGAEAPGRTSVPPGFEPDAPDDPLPERVATSWKAPTSGGSTGRPKIILSGGRGVTQPLVAAVFGIPDDGVMLVPGPLYHNAPFMFSSIGLFCGNHLVVMSGFDARQTLELIDQHRVRWTWLVPTMMNRIMRLEGRDRFDVSSLERVWHGAAACPRWVKEAFIDWLGGERVWELYGGTEAQGVTIVSGTDWLTHPGTVGRPIVGEFKVLDPMGDELPPGEVGELYMCTPDPNNPTYSYRGGEAREREGWESIGDMGWMDADGYVYIADRRTDLIVTGGANVYPAEVEAALDEHPAVRTCAVIGLPDDDLGHRVHAIVEMTADVTDAELAAFCADRLARYKIPRSWERSSEPLRDEAGKVRRSELRAARLGS